MVPRCSVSVFIHVLISAAMSDARSNPCVDYESLSNESQNEGGISCVEGQRSTALVVYDEQTNSLPQSLAHLRIPVREFKFAGQKLTIRQDWEKLGVASVVWDSAVVLSEYLERNRHFVDGKKIIELGAGTGLVGMTAAFLGGIVTVTDRKMVFEHLKNTVEENIKNHNSVSISVQPLDWTGKINSFTAEYDLILGADIIYIKETFNDLLKTLCHLSSSTSTILLSCRIRYEKDQDFLDQMTLHFSVQEEFYDRWRDIHIFKASKLCSSHN